MGKKINKSRITGSFGKELKMENNESQSSKLPVAPEQIDSVQIDSAENSGQSDSTLKKERTSGNNTAAF